jgi:hypothetical protein
MSNIIKINPKKFVVLKEKLNFNLLIFHLFLYIYSINRNSHGDLENSFS